MKSIKLEYLKITNMYGYASAEVKFTDGKNVIRNKMRYGKTTLLNCVLFALGIVKGKYQPCVEEYIIKDLESKVQMGINVDGLRYCLTVSSKQLWKVKDKETEEKVYIGNNLSYNFDGLDCKCADYKAKIAGLFGVPYERIEMLADIRYFNTDTTKWKWSDRRTLIYELLNVDEQTKTVAERIEFSPISDELRKGYGETEIQKALNAEKKRITDEQLTKGVLLKSKVAEKTNYADIDFAKLREEKDKLGKEIEQIKAHNANNANEKKRAELEEQLRVLRKKLQDTEFENQTLALSYETKKNTLQIEIDNIASDYRKTKDKLTETTEQIATTDTARKTALNSAFPETATKCPTCGKKLNDDEIAKAKGKFESEKQNTIAECDKKLAELKEQKSKYEKMIFVVTEKGKAKRTELNTCIENGYKPTATDDIKNAITAKQAELDNLPKSSTEEKSAELQLALERYSALSSKLFGEQKVAELDKDIAKLQGELRELAQADADRVRKQNALREYIIAKAEMASEIINSAFSGIKFRLFKMNGGNAENPIEPTFEVIHEISGYASQSHGQKIYSDICIGIALRKLYGIDMFMFIDEIQSVTEPYDYPFQTIELYTTASDVTDIVATKIRDIYTLENTVK